MKIYINGAAIIQKDLYGTLRLGIQKIDMKDLFQIESLRALFSQKPTRFGRFDQYTRLGCAAVGLALSDAGFDPNNKESKTGLILAGQYGSFVTDLDYQKTVYGGGQFASPNLFSYTLPNIVIGECANQFGFMGPTYCIDSDNGRASQALHQASVYLETKTAEAMLVGWLEVLPDQAPRQKEGAAVLCFGKKRSEDARHLELEADPFRGMRFLDGQTVRSIDELLHALRLSETNVQ
jgi:3-oxoacyl-(acyl-carrier-protein) synthase